MGYITMSIKESQQLGILQRLKNGEIMQKQAARELGLGPRQVRNKLKRFLINGAAAIVHRLRNRPSNNQFDFVIKKQVLELIAERYPDFGPTFAAEQLQRQHAISINAETLRNFMVKAGLWRVKKQGIKHRKWRERKAQFGQLVLFDGSPHLWLEDRGPYCTLLLYIDDATSCILAAAFAHGESTKNAMTISKEYFEHYGLPEGIYTDRGSVFKVSINNPDDDKITQFHRALTELNIKLIRARSPQAKGRVERCFQTLQDRLVKELRLANICSIKEANRYLKEIYIPNHNTKFGVSARQKGDTHCKEPANLSDILCIKTTRNLNQDFTVKYRNRLFQLLSAQQAVIRPKESITIQENLDGKIKLSIRGIWLNFDEIKQRPTKPKICKANDKIMRPAAKHPWRDSYKNIAVVSPNGGYFR